MNARSIVVVVALVGAWCALWESISFANVLSGVAVAVPAVLFAGSRTNGSTIRIVPAAKLVWLVTVDLVKSTIDVVWEILTPIDYTDERIMAVDTQVEARNHLLLLVVAITLTPGTAVVDTDPDTGTLYIHLLHADAEPQVIEHVRARPAPRRSSHCARRCPRRADGSDRHARGRDRHNDLPEHRRSGCDCRVHRDGCAGTVHRCRARRQ
jgi:multicomponent Na+:H+ antiporter subunit E